jgi:hypothetical protein
VISDFAPGFLPTAAAACPAAIPCPTPGPIPAITARPAPIAEHPKIKFVLNSIVISSLDFVIKLFNS